jgi:hypothetical protein
MTTAEVLEVDLHEFALRSRWLLLSHTADTELSRGLEPGEKVIVHDARRGYWTARVAEILFEEADTLYRLDLGVRLGEVAPHAEAPVQSEPASGPVTEEEVHELLGELRSRSVRLPPSGRRAHTAL